jgi:hypothetical protein
MRDDELKGLLRSQRDGEPVPEFDRCWRDARRRAAENGRRLDWRWGLGPGLAAALGAAVIALKILVPTNGSLQSPPSASQAEPVRHTAMTALSGEKTVALAEEDDEQVIAQPLALDWLLEYPKALSENGHGSGDDRDYLTNGSETDFLLTMEIPAWNNGEAREVL